MPTRVVTYPARSPQAVRPCLRAPQSSTDTLSMAPLAHDAANIISLARGVVAVEAGHVAGEAVAALALFDHLAADRSNIHVNKVMRDVKAPQSGASLSVIPACTFGRRAPVAAIAVPADHHGGSPHGAGWGGSSSFILSVRQLSVNSQFFCIYSKILGSG